MFTITLRMARLGAVALACGAGAAAAQMHPAGLWRSFDDHDGNATSEVRIVEQAGVLTGTITKVLHPRAKPDERCERCTDDRKDQLLVGMELLRGLKKSSTRDNLWDGGTVVEPSTGTIYKVQLSPIENGAKLELRGYIGVPLLGRTQTWIRLP